MIYVFAVVIIGLAIALLWSARLLWLSTAIIERQRRVIEEMTGPSRFERGNPQAKTVQLRWGVTLNPHPHKKKGFINQNDH